MAKRAMTAEAKKLKAHAILDKAAEMFSNSEYEKIKMSDIAKEMGMSNGILFVYFKTKEALFFSLLCRQYENRIARLTEIANETQVNDFDDFKKLVMKELIELVDDNPLYIRLESMRTVIFEKNVDAETMLKHKLNLYRLMTELVSIICRNNALAREEVMDILQVEASIITGCRLSATVPATIIDIIENNSLEGFKRDFRKDVIDTMRYYLNGYRRNHEEPYQ